MQRLCVSEHLQLHRQPLEIEEWTVMMMQLLWEFVEYSEVSHSLGDVGKNRCFFFWPSFTWECKQRRFYLFPQYPL